ncbi:MAG TPA: hypothetical protein VF138_13130 [Caulobacteraceae bacterium]
MMSLVQRYKALVLPAVIGLAFWGWFFGYRYYLDHEQRADVKAAAAQLHKSAPSSAVVCDDGCSDYDDGYRWAEDHMVSQEEDCFEGSDAFIEGCKAWVETLS